MTKRSHASAREAADVIASRDATLSKVLRTLILESLAVVDEHGIGALDKEQAEDDAPRSAVGPRRRGVVSCVCGGRREKSLFRCGGAWDMLDRR